MTLYSSDANIEIGDTVWIDCCPVSAKHVRFWTRAEVLSFSETERYVSVEIDNKDRDLIVLPKHDVFKRIRE